MDADAGARDDDAFDVEGTLDVDGSLTPVAVELVAEEDGILEDETLIVDSAAMLLSESSGWDWDWWDVTLFLKSPEASIIVHSLMTKTSVLVGGEMVGEAGAGRGGGEVGAGRGGGEAGGGRGGGDPVRRFASTGRGGGGGTPGWGAEHAALRPSRGKENVGRRRRNRGLVARQGTRGGRCKTVEERGGRPGPHPKPNKGWGPSGACKRRVPLGLVGCLGRGRGKTEGGAGGR